MSYHGGFSFNTAAIQGLPCLSGTLCYGGVNRFHFMTFKKKQTYIIITSVTSSNTEADKQKTEIIRVFELQSKNVRSHTHDSLSSKFCVITLQICEIMRLILDLL